MGAWTALILLGVSTGALADGHRPHCQLPVSEWLGEPALAQGFVGKEVPLLTPPLRKHLESFEGLFQVLHQHKTEARRKEILHQLNQWVAALPSQLPQEEQAYLAETFRRWAGVFLRDRAPSLDAATLGLQSRKFASLEKEFSRLEGPLSESLCLDREVTSSPEQAKSLRLSLLTLREQRRDIEEFSEELERQYRARIQENPAAGDRFLPYAYFLFTAGRIEEAEAQLRQAKALSNKLEGMAELDEAIERVKKITDMTERAHFIKAFVGSRRQKSEETYRNSRKRPSTGKVLPSSPALAPSPAASVPSLPPRTPE